MIKRKITEHARHFLGNFRGEVQGHLLEFCDEIWKLDSDVVIFMARKAAALFDCLRELGLADVRGLAVNDRVLDTNVDWLKGKSVTLVDDCVFSGTTLYRARHVLLRSGCRSCDVLALAVNSDTIRPELFPEGAEHDRLNFRYPLFKRTDSQCVQQCYDIVRAIASHPRPYDVDFPHTLTVKYDANDLSHLLLLPGWQAFDLSTRYQVERGVRVYTLIPDETTMGRFCEVTGHPSNTIQAAKLRIYARDLGSAWSVRMVPICMLSCCPPKDIVSATEHWLSAHGVTASDLSLSTATSMYRLLTYAVSYSLYSFLIDNSSRLAPSTPLGIRTDLLDMTFGPGFSQRAMPALNSTEGLHIPAHVPEPTVPVTASFESVVVRSDEPLAISQAVRDPFLWLYRNREVSARQIIRERGLEAINSPEYIQLDRLLYGFSASALMSRIESEEYDTARLSSLLIDRYVDMGIAVPTNVCTDDAIYRAFRHGEDAVFGEAQERLTLLSLEAYLETSKRENIWGLELQKFIVLFIQIALRNSLLDRVDTSSAVNVGCRVVSVKGHLHGPVPVSMELDPSGDLGPPYIEGSDSHPMWLVDQWVRRGILTESRSEHGKIYCISRVPDLSIGERPEASARSYGRAIAQSILLPSDQSPMDRNHEFVMLSTCSEPDHQVRALAAELRILHERWPHLVERLRTLVNDRNYGVAHRELRSGNDVFTAVNSGAMKYRWYVDHAFKKRVEEIRQSMLSIGKADSADSWRQLWPETLARDKSNTAEELQTNLDASGGWLVGAVFGLMLIDLWIVHKACEHEQIEHNELQKVLEAIETWCQYINQYCVDAHHGALRVLAREVHAHHRTATLDTTARWSQRASSLLDELCNGTSVLLTEESTLLLSCFAKATEPITVYPYALYLDIPGAPDDVRKILVKYIERAVQSLGAPHLLLPAHHNPWRRGVWLLLSGNRNSDRLCRVVKKVADALTSNAHSFRIVMIAQLSRVNSVRCKPGSPVLSFGNFFRRVCDLKDVLLAPDYQSSIGVASPLPSEGESECSKLARVTKWRSRPAQVVERGGEGLARESYEVSHFHHATAIKLDDPFADCDIGILTVLPTEASALRSVVVFGHKDKKGKKTDRLYDVGILKYGERELKIVHTQIREAGTVQAAAAFTDLLLESSPNLVCITGIAGSISAKATYGDVIVASKVLYYDRRKITEEGVSREALVYNATPYVRDLHNAYLRDNRAAIENRSHRGEKSRFKVAVAPIGCGEAVIARKDDECRRWLLDVDRKTLAVEMESAGVAQAMWELGKSRTENLYGVLVIRGISDCADEKKTDEYQFNAAGNAAHVMKKILRYHRVKTTED